MTRSNSGTVSPGIQPVEVAATAGGKIIGMQFRQGGEVGAVLDRVP
jgi:hypothetical protein